MGKPERPQRAELPPREAALASACMRGEPAEHRVGIALAGWIFMARRMRTEIFGAELFAEPGWDILLDLYAAHARGCRVQITSLAPMSGVPSSTARRWARKLVALELVVQERDPRDHRLTFLKLSARGLGLMSHYFASLLDRARPPGSDGTNSHKELPSRGIVA